MTGRRGWTSQVSLSPLLCRLNSASLVVLITAMLCERRIVFVSRNLSVLSACVHAAVSLLFPFEWPVREGHQQSCIWPPTDGLRVASRHNLLCLICVRLCVRACG